MTHAIDWKAELVSILPEVEVAAAEWREIQGQDYDPSPMIFFDNTLDPYLAVALESGTRDSDCRRLFEFFERLANHPDEQAVLCVAYALPRALQDHPRALARSDEFMGPRTRELVQEYLLEWTTWTRRKLPWRAV